MFCRPSANTVRRLGFFNLGVIYMCVCVCVCFVPLIGYSNRNMPDNFLDMFFNHPLVGASSSSLNRSWK